MKQRISTLEQFVNEQSNVNEAADKWGNVLVDTVGITMCRYSGKTWPCVMYATKEKKLFAREDNGPRPSATIESEDISVQGFKDLLSRAISKPWPSDEKIEEFISKIK
jgi:hypothetical protein